MMKTTRNPTIIHKLPQKRPQRRTEHLTSWATNCQPPKDLYSSFNPERPKKDLRYHGNATFTAVRPKPPAHTHTHTHFARIAFHPPPKKKKKKKIVFLHKSVLKSHCYCCKHPPHFHPTNAMHTHRLDSAAQEEETPVIVSFASSIPLLAAFLQAMGPFWKRRWGKARRSIESSIWPHGLFGLLIP